MFRNFFNECRTSSGEAVSSLRSKPLLVLPYQSYAMAYSIDNKIMCPYLSVTVIINNVG